MITIEKTILDEKDIKELCKLSNAWAFEDISWGINEVFIENAILLITFESFLLIVVFITLLKI